MVGKKQYQIDAQQFVQGLATNDYIPDGGLGTSSYNLNLIATPGVVRATGSTAVGGDTPSDRFLASCEDPQGGTTTSYHRLFVADDGTIYSTGGSSLTLRVTPASSSGYTLGITDMKVFDGAAWITRTTEVAKLQVSGTTFTYDDDWWTATKGEGALVSNVNHPMLNFEDLLWIADDNKLHYIDSSENVTTDALVLDVNERITALGIDPASGLMMIGTQTINSTDTDESARFFVQLFDGFSAKVRREIPVDGHVTCFKNVGGQVFVFMDGIVGIWNGSGVTFLRRLLASTTATPIWQQYVTSVENFLIVADGINLLAYGDIANGKKVWFPLYQNQVNSNKLTLVTAMGYDNSATPPMRPYIWLNETTNVREIALLDSTTVGAGIMYTPFVNFERPVFIRRVRVFTTGITTTAGLGGLALIDEFAQTRTCAVSTYVVVAAASPRYVFDFDYAGLKLQTLQGKFTLGTQAFGIVRIVIYYDVAE